MVEPNLAVMLQASKPKAACTPAAYVLAEVMPQAEMATIHDVTDVGEALLATLGPALESVDGALDALDQGRDRVSRRLGSR